MTDINDYSLGEVLRLVQSAHVKLDEIGVQVRQTNGRVTRHDLLIEVLQANVKRLESCADTNANAITIPMTAKVISALLVAVAGLIAAAWGLK